MPKERTINPAQAARKAEKTKALKKSKLEQRSRQNEKLARRNPERLQRQIDELKQLESSGGQLRPKDKQTLEALEKDLKGVRRAREALGDKAPEFGRRRDDGEGGGHLGKRRRDERAAYGRPHREPESETDEEVRGIPMPRDTPPPIPRRGRDDRGVEVQTEQRTAHALPAKPVVAAQTTYSSAPVLRDLVQESKRFVPAAVAQNIARQKGEGGRLLEPEELDKLESAGYGDAAGAAEEAVKEAEFRMMNVEAMEGKVDFEEEEWRLERELRQVEMEEVEDEDL
ncbi:hypothetical protein BT93_L4915 [Corymbia citriodora subsp. variegata]|uniref:Wbp11/ELF5/Saf1 N-terminal domain-containing protein n=1 Tax=Corymbia citriodora subsp. variegata TaxID=360336 RepID=A0A8T0CHH5_CORYI|nr:hypothetical protein BT93_L4915 [Corymbia citriodora subsp. variegata]